MSDGQDPAFEPVINEVDSLDARIREQRSEWDRAVGPMNELWLERVGPRLQACQGAVDALARYHALVVDRTDVDLAAATRWAAILASTARCIGLADALIDQLRRGYASETAGTARVLHEALDLAIALAAGDEAQARRWLKGKQYPVKLAQSERTAFFATVIEQADASAELDALVAAEIAAAEEELGEPIAGAVQAIHKTSGRTVVCTASFQQARTTFDVGLRTLSRWICGGSPTGVTPIHGCEATGSNGARG